MKSHSSVTTTSRRAASTASIALGLITTCLVGFAPVAGAADELTDTEREKLREAVEELEAKLRGGTSNNNLRAREAFEAALASQRGPYELFLECKKELDFEQQGRRESDWMEWRNQNEDSLREVAHLAALHLQLRYLIITIDVLAPEDREAALKRQIPAISAFVDDVAGSYEELDDHRGVLRNSVLSSVFAERAKLNLTLPQEAEWIYEPGNIIGMYDTVLLPYYRDAGSYDGLMAAWDKRIAHEGMLVAADGRSSGGGARGGGEGGERPGRGWRPRVDGDARDRERAEDKEDARRVEVAKEEFVKLRLPELNWLKQRDALIYGKDPAGATGRLTAIVRENLSHPQASVWLAELKTIAAGNPIPTGEEAIEGEPVVPVGSGLSDAEVEANY